MTSPLASRQQIGYRQVLAVRQFAFLAVAHTVSLLGSTVATVALAVLVFQRTGSPLLSSLTFTVSFTPYLLGGLLASRLEHVPPRRLMVLCDVVQGISFLALAVPGLPVAGLLGLLAVGSIPAPVFSGTRAGLLPGLLGDGEGFVLGRSVLRLISQTSQILGLAVGGALLLLITPRAALLVVAATCAGSAVLIRAGLSSQHHAAPVQTLRPRLGLRPVFADPQRRALLVLGWLVPAAAVATEALAVPYVVSLGLPAASAGLLLWAAPAGAVTGELLTVRLVPAARRINSVLPLTFLVLAVPLAFALHPPLPLAALLLLLSTAGFGYTLGLDQQLLDATPPELHRRTLTVSTAGLMFWQGAGFAIAGAAAEVATPQAVIPVLSLLGLAGASVLGLRTHSRRHS